MELEFHDSEIKKVLFPEAGRIEIYLDPGIVYSWVDNQSADVYLYKTIVSINGAKNLEEVTLGELVNGSIECDGNLEDKISLPYKKRGKLRLKLVLGEKETVIECAEINISTQGAGEFLEKFEA